MILFAGPPGSGKSTQAKLLENEQGLVWLSTGAILREVEDEKIQALLKKGELIDDSITQGVLANRIAQLSKDQKVLLDGYPRRISQVDWLDDFCKQNDRPVTMYLIISIPIEEGLKRMIKRGREDDTEETIKHRYEKYFKEMSPVFDHYKQQGIDVVDVDGIGSVDEVHQRVVGAINNVHQG